MQAWPKAAPIGPAGTDYREAEPGVWVDGVLCFKYRRTVAKDNAEKLEAHALLLLPGPHRTSYARDRVEIKERLDGSAGLAHQENVIASREAPPHSVVLRALPG